MSCFEEFLAHGSFEIVYLSLGSDLRSAFLRHMTNVMSDVMTSGAKKRELTKKDSYF